MKKLLLLLLSASASATAFSQEVEMDGVTITSALIEKRASETGRNIVIIKGSQFQNLPVHSIDDLLRFVPGVEIQARGPMGSQSDITLRGGTFQQVLVLLDGMRLNDPNTGHFSSYIPLAPAEIERIEVLKGPSSAIYGADAVGGVVHVITKTFVAQQQGITKTSANGQLAIGEYGFNNITAGIAHTKNKFSVSGGVLINNAEGAQQRGTKGFIHNSSVSASAKYQFNNNWSVAYRLSYDRRNFGAQNFYTTFLSDTAREKVATWWQQLRVAYQKGNHRLTIDASYKTLDDDYRFNSLAIANNNESKLAQALISHQYNFSPKTILTTGFNYQQKMIKSNDRGDHSLFLAAPFVSLVQKIGQHVFLQPSLRLEMVQHNDPELVPQLTASYKADQWQFRVSGGKTIRDADFTERFNNYNKPLVTGGRIGNPDLQAEHSWSYEAGADWFYHNRLKISATVFQRQHSRLIDYVNTAYADMPRKENLSPTGTYALAKNIAKVNTSGLETDIQYTQPISSKQQLAVNAGFIWLSSKSSNNTASLYVSSHARVLTNFSVQYNVCNFSLALTGLYKHRRPDATVGGINAKLTSDYFIMNARLSYALLKNRLSFFVQADNVFDRSYSDLLGAIMPGRWAMGGVKFNFQK
ncbi:TonB-dependent receptor plug domain-containing protein [Terrimonas rubra]|uniref:TonB-dependent receptor plug domain-containing protein n=1 Tax=Terrimonas rubra TaxID=1035890 RepID=A0ABW6A5U7_9BACT